MATAKKSAANKPRVKFDIRAKAVAWAKQHGNANCLPYQIWKICPFGDEYVVGIYSRNTGYFSHYAS